MRNAWNVLEETQRVLEQIQNLYLQPLNDHILPFIEQAAANLTIRASSTFDNVEVEMVEAARRKFKREIHATFAHSLPLARFYKTLSYMIYDAACQQFRFKIRHDDLESGNTASEDPKQVRERMIVLLMGLERVGLGQDNAQRAMAQAMNKLLDAYIASHYLKVDWYSKQPMTPQLRLWIENGFVPMAELILECLKCETASIAPLQRKQWQEMALTRLGRARVEDLFDFVTNWDQSLGAILDLKVSKYLRNKCTLI